MFLLVGGILAFFAVFSAFAGVPVASAVFALLALAWIVLAKPARRNGTAKQVDRWGNVYEVRTSR